MMSEVLLLSIFIASVLVNVNAQAQQSRCIATTVVPKVNGNYTFALASMEGTSSAQEACYYGCNAQILTKSRNTDVMKELTMLDRALPYLLSSKFFDLKEVYFVNHLGFQDEQAGTGIGCMQVQGENALEHFPADHQSCVEAKVAVCGFWGTKATVSSDALSSQSLSLSSGNDVGSSNMATQPILSSYVVSTSSVTGPLLSETSAASSSQAYHHTWAASTTAPQEVPVRYSVQPQSTIVPGDAPDIRLSAGNAQYRLVASKNVDTLDEARAVCKSLETDLGIVGSDGLPTLSQQLQISGAVQKAKVIIGSWNGDHYGVDGAQCLLMEAGEQVLFTAECKVADAVLCQGI